MVWLGNLLSFFGGLVAAAVAAYVAFKTNQKKMDADIQGRWDAALLEKSMILADAARSTRHYAERFDRSVGEGERTKQIDQAHEKLRIASEQLRIVGSQRVQIAARLVVHHAYSVRIEGESGEDPRRDKYPTKKPVVRLNDALQMFYQAVRQQLRAPDAEGVIHDQDLEDILEGKKTTEWRQV